MKNALIGLVLAVLGGVFLLAVILNLRILYDSKAPEFKKMNCTSQVFSFRARKELITVCRERGTTYYWDTSYQTDSTRQAMIEDLLKELK